MDEVELKTLLKKFNLKPSKKLGQNFLLSEKVLDEIITASELSKDDKVLEIGPGLGTLTRELGKRAGQVLAIEKDQNLVNVLHRMFRGTKAIKVIKGDALFIKPEDYGLKMNNYKLIANIPYYITGKLLKNFLTTPAKPSLIVLLVQKEVAERIVAQPGKMSILSLSVQFYAEPELVSIVPRQSFYPQPAVDSAVIKIKVLLESKLSVNEKQFFQMIKTAFSSPRKLLLNNLASGLQRPKEDIAKNLEQIGIAKKARAQDLSMIQWGELIKFLF